MSGVYSGPAAPAQRDSGMTFSPGCAQGVRQGATSRKVYLPAGATWTDAWTGQELKGGQTVQAAAPLEKIPLYLRNGRRLPIHS